MALSTITSKGQITIPKAIREKLMIDTGDKIEFILTNEREALIRPISKTVDELFGKLNRPGIKPVSTQAMDEAISKKFKKEFR
ncbi:transcriptional regulator, AbrB family [Desulfosarcina variabilis str. Montpellier]|uniref:AbrB/MazE/SpoVT family DNA-binding domain-containing protein n=1 Tax=Desulfosarcina variabilis TaxID=2300 RepID=UPI003AFA51AA